MNHPLCGWRRFPLSTYGGGGRQPRCGAALARCLWVGPRQLHRLLAVLAVLAAS